MKQVTSSRRVIRVPAAVHQAAKVQAASEDRTLADLAAEALAEALERRRKERELCNVSQAAPTRTP